MLDESGERKLGNELSMASVDSYDWVASDWLAAAKTPDVVIDGP